MQEVDHFRTNTKSILRYRLTIHSAMRRNHGLRMTSVHRGSGNWPALASECLRTLLLSATNRHFSYDNMLTQNGVTKSSAVRRLPSLLWLFFERVLLFINSSLSFSKHCFRHSGFISHSSNASQPIDVHPQDQFSLYDRKLGSLVESPFSGLVMPLLRSYKMKAMDKFRSTRNRLKSHLATRAQRNPESSESRKLSIVGLPTYDISEKLTCCVQGYPFNFRREPITMGSDILGNAIIIERAREDAKEMHEQQQMSKRGNLKGSARKIEEV